MSVHNSRPKPRALFINFSEEELAALHVEKLFAHHRAIPDHALHDVNQGEFEVAVMAEAEIVNLSQHLYIVSLGGNEFPPRFYKNDSYKTEVERYLEGSAATELYVDDGLPAEIRDAAISTLLPIFTLEPKHPILANGRTFLMDHGRPVQQIPTNFASWLPVVSDVDGRILAGYFERVEGRPSEQWYLPPQIEGKALHRWLDILLKRWSLKEPENFPRISDWKADLRWQSPKERESIP